ncbi:MAG: FtsX-like permease family protein [Spirochaetota bacterium]
MNLGNLLRHISFKHIKHQKTQLIVAISGICLGVAAMISLDIVNRSVLQSFEESMNQIMGRASLQVTLAGSGFPEEMLDKVQKVQGVEYAVPVIEANTSLSGGTERALMILGIDTLQDSNVRSYSIKDESADIPDPLLFLAKRDSILITQALADREGIKIDQEIKVQTVQGIKRFKVRGLLNPEGPAKAAGGDIAIMDIFAAQLAFGKENRIDRIDMSLLPGETIDTVKERIEHALPKGYNIDTPAGRTKQVEILLGSYRNFMRAFSLMALIVGMYLIYNAVSISTVQRRKEIGILRAIGARKGEIVRLFLGETFLFSALGSVLGVVLGVLFAKLSIGMVAKSLTETYIKISVDGLIISWIDILRGGSIGIFVSLVSAAAPAFSISKISPISAIRSLPYSGDGFFFSRRIKIISAFFFLLSVLIIGIYKIADISSSSNYSGLVWLSTLFLMIAISLLSPYFLKWFLTLIHPFLSFSFGSLGRLAGMNLQKSLTRNAVAVAAIFFSICLFVSSANIVNSFRKSVFDWIESIVRADIFISSGHLMASGDAPTVPMSEAMLKEIEKIPKILTVEPFRKNNINYKGSRIILHSIDVAMRMGYCPLMIAEGRREDVLRLLPGKDNLTVNESFATRYHIKPGDTIILPTPISPIRFSVAAIIADYSSEFGSIYMDTSTYKKHWKDNLVDTYEVRVKSPGDLVKVKEAILEQFGKGRKLFVLSGVEFRAEVHKMLDSFFALFNAVNILTLIIAGFGIVIALLASVMERTREIGILRSIGMKRSQVSRIILIESAVIGLTGGLMGTVVGILTGWIIFDGFYQAAFGASMKYNLFYPALFAAIILSVGLSVLAGLYPARRAAKTNIVEALSYE